MTVLGEARLAYVLEHATRRTMVPEAALRFTIEQTLDVIDRGISGAIVECGVWRGGSSIAMLLAQEQRHDGDVPRKVYMLDSFQGLPPVGTRDGPLAAAWQADTTAPNYYDNCYASYDELRQALLDLQLPYDSWELVPGWFSDTVPVLAERLRQQGIALLRIDGDWYDSTIACLESLVPLVHDDGVVLIDDYYAWDGCARAVHDYLSRHDLAYRIRTMPATVGAYFVKRASRTNPEAV
jgi:O-methyltransferase